MSTTKYIYDPTDVQSYFHECSDDYIVLGGSRGSGKSYCLLIEALGLAYDSHINGGWQALIMRRTIPQLKELLVRAQDLYPKIVKDIRYNEQQKIFTFPNGSFIQFGSCERDEAIEQYRGREFCFIGVDELSHFDSDYCWNWLKSCNRNSRGYPNRMVGTSNPCQWVKKMCKINDMGHSTLQRITFEDPLSGQSVDKTLRFIQMNLESNPHLSLDYRAGIAQDAFHYDEWLLGLWKTPPVPGQVLEEELRRFTAENRCQPIAREATLPVHVFTDIGYSDHTSLVFCQFLGQQIKILDFYENNRCSVDVYIEEILKRYGDKAIVHLPHDGSKHESNGETVRQYWEKRIKVAYDSPNFQGNLPRLQSNAEYLHRVKNGFSRIWINDTPACQELITHLRQYRRRFDANTQTYGEPIHDEHSHSFDAVKYIFCATISNPSLNTNGPRILKQSRFSYGGAF